MKIILVVTIIAALIVLCLAWTTEAAPTQWNINYPGLKNELYKSIISQALAQQEDSSSTKDKDKEMVATYCKLLLQVVSSFITEFVEGPIDDYCKDFELPPEPKPEERSSKLAEAYRQILNILKKTGVNGDNIIG